MFENRRIRRFRRRGVQRRVQRQPRWRLIRVIRQLDSALCIVLRDCFHSKLKGVCRHTSAKYCARSSARASRKCHFCNPTVQGYRMVSTPAARAARHFSTPAQRAFRPYKNSSTRSPLADRSFHTPRAHTRHFYHTEPCSRCPPPRPRLSFAHRAPRSRRAALAAPSPPRRR